MNSGGRCLAIVKIDRQNRIRQIEIRGIQRKGDLSGSVTNQRNLITFNLNVLNWAIDSENIFARGFVVESEFRRDRNSGGDG